MSPMEELRAAAEKQFLPIRGLTTLQQFENWAEAQGIEGLVDTDITLVYSDLFYD